MKKILIFSFVLLLLLFVIKALPKGNKSNKIGLRKKIISKSKFYDLKTLFNYTGYIPINEKYDSNLYYWFIPSLKNPKLSPVIIYLDGGPGCSSMIMALNGIGPILIEKHTLNVIDNPYKWNDRYNLLIIDQPTGTGFSYVNKTEGYRKFIEETTKDLYKLLTLFFQKPEFLQYIKNDLYIAGSSYGGKYVPAIGNEIIKQGFYFNLKGIMVGDGLTHPLTQTQHYANYWFHQGYIDINENNFVKRKQNQLKQYILSEDYLSAVQTFGFINAFITNSSTSGKINIYDSRSFKEEDTSAYIEFLHQPQIISLMKTEGHYYQECNPIVFDKMKCDVMRSVLKDLENIVQNEKVKVIYYGGNFDGMVPITSQFELLHNLEWNGKIGFRNQKKKIFKNSKGEVGGYCKKYKGLTDCVIVLSGHLQEVQKPLTVKEIMIDFIENQN